MAGDSMKTQETDLEIGTDPSDTDDFLRIARDRLEFGLLVDKDDRERAEEDNKFAYADDKDLGQWDDKAKRARKRRPILQWNRIPTSVQQVANDGRENKPSIRITVGDGGAAETAEFLQARIRQIEYESNADTAKDTARDQQITTGRGFIRVRTEYIPGTFRQRIRIDRIENQFSVVWDPASFKYDRSDADWCFVISLISKAQHIRDYGEDSVIHRMPFADCMKMAPEWIGVGDKDDLIQVAEYWVKEYRKRTLCLLGSTGLPAWKDELTQEQYDTFKRNGNIHEERDEQFPTVVQYVINGLEVLKGGGGTGPARVPWIGSTIPIIPVWGKETVVDGKRRTYSLIRNAKDPQRLLNLLVSNLAEKLAQMAKAPYKMPVGGVPAGEESAWDNAHLTPRGFLLFNVYDKEGRPIPEPSRVDYEPPIQALIVGIRESIDAIKASMGIYDAALGNRSNETSGLAIRTRKKESDVANYHFPDNEARSNKYLGEVIVELIPKLDKPGTNAEIRTDDGKTHVVPIGTPHQDWKTGEIVTHDLMSGQYKVACSTGLSYDSQREEALARDVAIVQANPELIWAIGPQMFRADDSAGSEDRATALERYINIKFPGMIPPPKNKNSPPPIPQEALAKMQAMAKQLEEVTAFSKDLHSQLQAKKPELDNAVRIKQMEIQADQVKWQAEIASKEKIAADAESTKRTLGLATLNSNEALAQLEKELGIVHKQVDMMHEASLLSAKNKHAATVQSDSLVHQAEQSQIQREHAAEQAEVERQHQAELLAQTQTHEAAQSEADRAVADPPTQTPSE